MLKEVWGALEAGKELSDAAQWKNRQATASALAAVGGLIIIVLPKLGIPIPLSSDDVTAIAGGLAALLGALSTYLTVATSSRIGVSPSVAAPSDQTTQGE